MTTRIGIIGIGGFAAHYHLPHLLARDDVRIAGICEKKWTRVLLIYQASPTIVPY